MIEPKAELLINYQTIQENVSYLKSLLSPLTSFMAIIKANAYGHSLEKFVIELDALVDGYGVVRLEEAISIRKISSKPVLLMQGLYSEEGFQIAANNNFFLTVHHSSQLELAKKFNSSLSLWLKFNTGMNRLGFDISDQTGLNYFNLEKNCLMSHLACADIPQEQMNQQQFALFNELSRCFDKTKKSILNSAGILHFPEYGFDWVSIVTVPVFGLGINPLGPNTRPKGPNLPITLGIVMMTSTSVQPFLIFSKYSSRPT